MYKKIQHVVLVPSSTCLNVLLAIADWKKQVSIESWVSDLWSQRVTHLYWSVGYSQLSSFCPDIDQYMYVICMKTGQTLFTNSSFFSQIWIWL